MKIYSGEAAARPDISESTMACARSPEWSRDHATRYSVAKPSLELRGLRGQKPDSLCVIAEDVHDVGELKAYTLE